MSINWKKVLEVLNGHKNDDICNKGRTKKLFFTGHEQLSISAKSENIEEEVTNTAYNILQKYKNQPALILEYIKANGTNVVASQALSPLIKFLGYEDGFIPKHTSIKAFILNFAISRVTKEKPDFSMTLKDTFLICRKDLSLYFLAYQFHHWLSYKNNLPGYDYETLCLFRTTMNTNANLSVLDINQILSIKDAIDRDKQALDFVTKFVREQVGAKERLQKILDGKKVNI